MIFGIDYTWGSASHHGSGQGMGGGTERGFPGFETFENTLILYLREGVGRNKTANIFLCSENGAKMHGYAKCFSEVK